MSRPELQAPPEIVSMVRLTWFFFKLTGLLVLWRHRSQEIYGKVGKHIVVIR